MQFPDFRSVNSRSCRPAQPLAVLPRMRQTCPSALPQDLSFKLREYCEEAGHRTTSGRGQV
jgi:hypothetical protein